MSIGQPERATQNRIVALFRNSLGYDSLGNWHDHPDNSNIEESRLRSFLSRQGNSETLMTKALYELHKVANDQTKSLYDINKEVYGLLRYGVQVREEVGENTQTV